MWDIFICHASEDKEEIARPLAKALRQVGLKVWYDEFSLTLGDSLRRSIDRGLNESRYGLVVLSPNFFKKEWPQRELDGLAAREISSGKIILPVWHKVSYEDVVRFSPPLADKLAVSTSKGLDAVVQEIHNVFSEEETRKKADEQTDEPVKEEQPVRKIPIIRLRSKPLMIPHERAEQEFLKPPVDTTNMQIKDSHDAHLFLASIAGWWDPREYIQNDFEEQGEVVIDHATGLMWQKFGSKFKLSLQRHL